MSKSLVKPFSNAYDNESDDRSNNKSISRTVENCESSESLPNGETPIKNPTYNGPLIILKREEELKRESNLMLNKISSNSLVKAPYKEISPRKGLGSSLSGWNDVIQTDNSITKLMTGPNSTIYETLAS